MLAETADIIIAIAERKAAFDVAGIGRRALRDLEEWSDAKVREVVESAKQSLGGYDNPDLDEVEKTLAEAVPPVLAQLERKREQFDIAIATIALNAWGEAVSDLVTLDQPPIGSSSDGGSATH